MATTVVGLFDDRDTAQSCVRDLIDAGFARADISVVAADPGGRLYRQHTDEEGNIAGEGAATGLTSGAVVGGLLGLLIGAGLIFVPAGVLAAGPITGLIAGGAAGAATGGVLGGLIGLGIPKDEADVYAEGIRRGGTLVSVVAEEGNVERAHRILDRDGAVDIEDRAAQYRSEGFNTYEEQLPVYTDEEAQSERERRRTAAAAGTTNEASSGQVPGGNRVRRYNAGSAYADYPGRDADENRLSTALRPDHRPGRRNEPHPPAVLLEPNTRRSTILRRNIVGYFARRSEAEEAAKALREAGCHGAAIRLVAAESEANLYRRQIAKSGNFVSEGAATGVTGGALVGGLIGYLIGAGILLAPAGANAGPVGGVLVGSISGAVVGGMIGAILGLGVPSRDSSVYEELAVREETLLVATVRSEDVEAAEAIVARSGPQSLRVTNVLPGGPTDEAYAFAEAIVETPAGSPATTDHAYADNPPGNAVPVGDTTDTAPTMGGQRPRYGSLESEENRTPRA